MNDPYETLKVPRDANGAEIKKAHRERARESHPDKGGSEAEFSEVAQAYAILKDPDARAHYDATGEAPQAEPVAGPAGQLILTVLHGTILAKGELDDVLGQIRDEIEDKLGSYLQNLELAKHGEQMAREQLGRFEFRGEGDNLLESSFKQMKEKSIAMQEQLNREIETCEAALEMLDDYSDTWEPEPSPTSALDWEGFRMAGRRLRR